MKTLFYAFFSLIAFLQISLSAVGSSSGMAPDMAPPKMGIGSQPHKIEIDNRIVAKINGNVISMYDVQKKMDRFLKRNNRKVYESLLDRYQFYMTSWRATLEDIIQTELMVMEAEELKLQIPDGDIKEEMERQYTHNMIPVLEDLGLTYSEAYDLTRKDVISRSLSYHRVWARVFQEVSPEVIKTEYKNYVTNLPNRDKWTYQTITIKADQAEQTQELAKEAYNLLQVAKGGDFAELASSLQTRVKTPEAVNLSSELALTSHELSAANRTILENLRPNSFSEPVLQSSRVDGAPVYRIFYLKDFEKSDIPALSELEEKIQNRLMSQEAKKQAEAYFTRLRKHFGYEDLVVDQLFNASYQPFIIY